MNDFNTYFLDNIILITILLFTVTYLIMNGMNYKGDCTKPILITLIVILVAYLFCDMPSTNSYDQMSSVPTYRIVPKSLDTMRKYNMMNPKRGNNVFLKQSDMKHSYRLKY